MVGHVVMSYDSCISDTCRFVEFMELNLQLLGSAAAMKKWLKFVSKLIREEKKSMAVATLRMVGLISSLYI